MKTIWKFPLDLSGGNEMQVNMPEYPRILSAGVQGGDFVIWAAVNPDADLVPHRFAIHGTGHPIDHDMQCVFINTVFMGPLVFHVFDRGAVNQ